MKQTENLLEPDIMQYIYLDFDGADTIYRNEDLDITLNIKVESSGMTEEQKEYILTCLNKKFADSAVCFTLEEPVAGEYSTVYVGMSDDFNAYGAFSGLSETIDKGNQIRNDNAFVFADNTADIDAVVSVIDHEVGHIVEGMEHGKNDVLDDYAYPFSYGTITSFYNSSSVEMADMHDNYSFRVASSGYYNICLSAADRHLGGTLRGTSNAGINFVFEGKTYLNGNPLQIDRNTTTTVYLYSGETYYLQVLRTGTSWSSYSKYDYTISMFAGSGGGGGGGGASTRSPDLAVSSFTVVNGVASDKAGASGFPKFTFTVKNQGNASAGACSAYIYKNGSYYTSVKISSLSAGGSATYTYSGSRSDSGGTYTVEVDALNVVSESNENNNMSAKVSFGGGGGGSANHNKPNNPVVIPPDADAVDCNLLDNGCSQIVGWDRQKGAVGYVATNGKTAPQWRGIWDWSGSDASLWRVAGVGYFEGSQVDHDGILLYNGVNNTFAAWTDLNDPSYGYVSLCHVEGNFNAMSIADLDGAGYDDILIYDEKGSFGVVLDGTVYKDIWHVDYKYENEWNLLGTASFGNERDSILVENLENGHLYRWDKQTKYYSTWDWQQTDLGYLGNEWEFVAAGDFKNDGADDILVRRKADNGIWMWDNGKSSTAHWVVTPESGFKAEAVGDYNGDGKEDLLVREYNTGWGGVGYYAFGGSQLWNDLNARVETDLESSFAVIA